MRNHIPLIMIMLTAALGFTSCQTTQEVLQVGEGAERNPGPCPRAFTLYDAARLIEFEDNIEQYDHIQFTGQIEHVRSLCRYISDRPINADLEIHFSLGRGPGATSSQKTYTYFIAVTRKNLAVITKEVFPFEITFPEGTERLTHVEKISEINIPRATETTSGENFEIIVGFVITPEQRAFNALGKRFRVSVGQTP